MLDRAQANDAVTIMISRLAEENGKYESLHFHSSQTQANEIANPLTILVFVFILKRDIYEALHFYSDI